MSKVVGRGPLRLRVTFFTLLPSRVKDPNNYNQQTTNPFRLTNMLNSRFATIENKLAKPSTGFTA